MSTLQIYSRFAFVGKCNHFVTWFHFILLSLPPPPIPLLFGPLAPNPITCKKFVYRRHTHTLAVQHGVCVTCVQILSQFGDGSTLAWLVLPKLSRRSLCRCCQQPPTPSPLPPLHSSAPQCTACCFSLSFHMEINNLYANFGFAFAMNMENIPVAAICASLSQSCQPVVGPKRPTDPTQQTDPSSLHPSHLIPSPLPTAANKLPEN